MSGCHADWRINEIVNGLQRLDEGVEVQVTSRKLGSQSLVFLWLNMCVSVLPLSSDIQRWKQPRTYTSSIWPWLTLCFWLLYLSRYYLIYHLHKCKVDCFSASVSECMKWFQIILNHVCSSSSATWGPEDHWSSILIFGLLPLCTEMSLKSLLSHLLMILCNVDGWIFKDEYVP